MNLNRILITAPSSGSGKTLITCGIMEALKRRKMKVGAFKCGPDYIDPMFHKKVLNIPSKNLDSFMADENTLKYLFKSQAEQVDISVIEGVMGYYDGLSFDDTKASTYEVAKITKTPAILVINARGMALSAIAAIKGFIEFAADSGIKGVILNRVTKMTFMQLAPVIEEKLGIKVLGFIPECKDCQFESRHLGLITPAEISDINVRLSKMADLIEENVDLDGIIKIAENAPDFCCDDISEIENVCEKYYKFCCDGRKHDDCVKIAVAYDEAFCFYYEDNFELLKKLGARLEFFSPMKDKKLPDNISGIMLGGGYPEIYAKQLSENTQMLDEIRSAYKNKIPIVAECGGFLYLHREIEDLEYNVCKMAGIIDAKAVYTGKLGRFGYIDVELKKKQMYGDVGGKIKGHEFHYYDSSCNGNDALAVKPSKKRQWECINSDEYLEAGFPHLYYYSNINFARNFVKKCIITDRQRIVK